MPDTLIQHFSDSGSEALSLLMQPRADLIYIGITPYALAIRLGMQLKIVGVAQRLGAAHGVVLRNPLTAKYRRSLSKQHPLVLATMAGSTGHEIASGWALKEHIPVRFLYLSPARQVGAFKDGYVDGIASWEPFLTKAVNHGGVSACNANCLDTSIYNIICARESSLDNKANAIERYLRATLSVTSELAAGRHLGHLASLPWLYGRDLKLRHFQEMIRDGYYWPTQILSNFDKFHLERALNASNSFLERNGFPSKRHDREELYDLSDSGPSNVNTTLHLGLTDSFMCTAHHLALVGGEIERHGFATPRESLTRGQRLAMLRDLDLAERLDDLENRAEDKPARVMAECRQYAEGLLMKVYICLHDGARPKDKPLEPLIRELNDLGCFTEIGVYSIAHSLRSAGNEAIHPDGISQMPTYGETLKARQIVSYLLKLYEWFQTEATPLLETRHCCIRCDKLIERSSRFCPFCTVEQRTDCWNCGNANLKPSFKSCPKCGALRAKSNRMGNDTSFAGES